VVVISRKQYNRLVLGDILCAMGQRDRGQKMKLWDIYKRRI